jgi:hypothetical protein
MRRLAAGLAGAGVGAGAMLAWISFVNRPTVEHITVFYDLSWLDER